MPHSGARVPPLSRGTIDRAAHRRTDRQWLSAAWRDRDRARLLELAPDGSAPVADGRLVLRVPESSDPLSAAWFLGEQGRHAYFVLPVSHGQPSWRSLREVGAELSDTDAGLFSHALALVQWHASHPRCPRCGGLTEVIDAGAARRCLVDGSTHFPRTDPAVIMLVTDPSGERALLGRQSSWTPGRYSTLAGFVEPGESAEQAVAREVAEEVGVRLTTLVYVASQPWPFPASLMLGFRAVTGDEQVAVDPTEIEAARWFSRDELRTGVASGAVSLPSPASIAHLLISEWLEEGGEPYR